jgi:hypothetical protein
MVRSDLLKRLKESQLEMLLAAIESRGADLSACVLLPRDQPPLLDPRLLCCQLWRWPDLRQAAELKRLPVCRSSKDTVYICCNPYHWSRLCKPGKSQKKKKLKQLRSGRIAALRHHRQTDISVDAHCGEGWGLFFFQTKQHFSSLVLKVKRDDINGV